MSTTLFAQPALPMAPLDPALRLVGEGLAWLGGGVVFATTVYLLIALPWLIG